MEIYPLGLSSFKIRAKSVTLVTDPYDSTMVGLKFPKNVDADIVTVSHEHADHNHVAAISGSPFVVRGPGEYEIKGVSVIGVSTYHDAEEGNARGKNTVYRIEIEGVRFAHLGDLGHGLTSAQLDAIDGVDVVFVPVGGFYSLDPAKASEVIADIEPRIVIPMHYGRTELNQKVFGQLSPLSAFLKQMGKDGITPLPKLVLSKDKLPQEMQIVVLE